MKALSIKQPWAHAILHLGKDIENRTRHTKHRGTVMIHTSKTIDVGAYYCLKSEGYELPSLDDLVVGSIVGSVEIIDSVEEHNSVWKEDGTKGYVLKNPKSLKSPIPCKGNLGFWNVPDDVEKLVSSQENSGKS